MTHCILPSVKPLDSTVFAANRQRVQTLSPLVHCMTNDVVQEITANVLLSIGASPAMVVAKEESGTFAAISSALLINIGTPRSDILEAMHCAVDAANTHNVPWVLDPVAAGVIAWRDGVIHSFLEKHPACVRGNASEIRALAGVGSGGKGVDSLDSSESALEAAVKLAKDYQTLVCVTGESDFATDAERIVSVKGGTAEATLVVGTGCSLSAMVAAYLAKADDPLLAVASACAHAKAAQEKALETSKGPGSFKVAYIDALHAL